MKLLGFGKAIEETAKAANTGLGKINSKEDELTKRLKYDNMGGLIPSLIRPFITFVCFSLFVATFFYDFKLSEKQYLTLHYLLMTTVSFYFGDRGVRRIIKELRK